MKSSIFVVALLIAMAAVGCSTKKTEAVTAVAPTDTVEALAFDSIVWNDSAVMKHESMASVDLRCLFPVSGSQALIDSIRYWICEEFEDTLHHHAKDIKTMVASYGKKHLASDKAEIAELLKDNDDNEEMYPVNYETSIDIYPIYEDSDYVTMESSSYYYAAGAHGTSPAFFMTFSKRDGHRCSYEDFLPGLTRKQITDKIKLALMGYFEFKGTLAERHQALFEDLFIEGDDEASRKDNYTNHFPLPQCPPYLTKQGIEVVYQQYEIASYAEGLPGGTIGKLKK